MKVHYKILLIVISLISLCGISVRSGQLDLKEGRERITVGDKHPSDGWEIGAYEYFAGEWIGVRLLFFPRESIFYETNLVDGEITLFERDPSWTNNPPSSITTNINNRLKTIAEYAKTFPEEPTFPHLRDFIFPNYSFKIFLDPEGEPFSFYYNGPHPYSRFTYHIADLCRTDGISREEYVKILDMVPTNTNVFQEAFAQQDWDNGLLDLRQFGLIRKITNKDQSKTINISYDSPFVFSVFTNDVEAAFRIINHTGTDEDTDYFNQAVTYVIAGKGSQEQNNDSVITLERVFFGYNTNDYETANQYYLEILDEILLDLGLAGNRMENTVENLMIIDSIEQTK